MRHEEAIAVLREKIVPVCTALRVDLGDAAAKVLSRSIKSDINIPAFNNAAVDGYAFDHSQLVSAHGKLLMGDRIAAGDRRQLQLKPGTAARIFTGAPVPLNADTVAMQEDCSREIVQGVEKIAIPMALKKGANIRKLGEDVSSGDIIVPAGRILRPQDIAAIASCGVRDVEVFQPLKIGIASTGDEVIRPGTALLAGQLYDANYFMIAALAQNLPVQITDLGILPDERAQIEKVLDHASDDFDVLITSGGASRGSEDHVTNILNEKGKRYLWQLAIKPGRPMCFGKLNNSWLFALPGNPVASFICFLLYVRPALAFMGGADWHEPRRYMVASGFDLDSKKIHRREFWRGYIDRNEDGNNCLFKYERDGSGLISGLQKAQGLIEICEMTTNVEKGDELPFIPFSEFGINFSPEATQFDQAAPCDM